MQVNNQKQNIGFSKWTASARIMMHNAPCFLCGIRDAATWLQANSVHSDIFLQHNSASTSAVVTAKRTKTLRKHTGIKGFFANLLGLGKITKKGTAHFQYHGHNNHDNRVTGEHLIDTAKAAKRNLHRNIIDEFHLRYGTRKQRKAKNTR